MYSVQHVLWRGAMALSLLVVGGVGAGVSVPQQEQVRLEECQELPTVAAYRQLDLGTIVVVANAKSASGKSVSDEA
jgi:hypothetical protein